MNLVTLALWLAAGQATPPQLPPELASTVQFAVGGDLIAPWQAYVVELDNKSPRDLDLEIRIEDDNFLSVATRRERLSPAARKRVFLYAPGGPYPRTAPARYRIKDAAGRELAAGIIPVSSRGHVAQVWQVGLYSRTPATEEDFGFPNTFNGVEVRFGRLSGETFPDRWIGLSGLDLLVLHDAALDELTIDQGRALADYVRQGGTVVLSPGPSKGWISHPVLASLAVVKTGEPRLVTLLPALNALHGPFVRAEPFLIHPLLNGAEFKAFGREIVRFDSGLGRVFALSFDVRRAPFDSWSTGRRALWGELLSSTPRWFQEERSSFPPAAGSRQRADLLQQMARMINPYPSLGLIYGLAALFVLLVGPLNYLLLWRLKKTLLLVVTVPAISIGFLAFILALGYVLKGTTTVVHSARLLATRSGGDCAREIQLLSFFSPSTRAYDVGFPSGSCAQPVGRLFGDDYNPWRSRETVNTLVCETGAGLTLRGMGAGQWQSWSLEGRALRDLGKGVRFEQNGLQVRIANDTPRRIERGIYVQTGREPVVAPFGEIAPGKTAEARMDGPRPQALEALGLPRGTLGERLLQVWIDSHLRPRRPDEVLEGPSRFLICILAEDPLSFSVDAHLSSRSQSITLLHVGEAP